MTRTLIIVLPDLTAVHKADLTCAAKAHGFSALFFNSADEALEEACNAEIILGSAPELAKRSPHLRWLCTPSAGVNQFLQPGTFVSPDTVLTNSSGAYGVTIAEHIVMVTLEMMRRRQEYTGLIQRREWIRDLPIRSIQGCCITMLGTGDIGREAAIRLRAFSPKWIIGVNRSGNNPDNLFDRVMIQDQLDAILPQTDLLIMSLPGTSDTNRLLNTDRLALLPKGAYIVNVGRGSTIDQAALLARLNAGLLYAALDVFEREPPPNDDDIWTCPNLLITPHAAGNTSLAYTVGRIVDLFIEDFDNYCMGRPLVREVNLSLGY